jgi:hypothetical protein
VHGVRCRELTLLLSCAAVALLCEWCGCAVSSGTDIGVYMVCVNGRMGIDLNFVMDTLSSCVAL